MSRYTVKFGTVEYAYGYDRPLQDYFFEKSDSSKATDENDEGYIFQVSSSFSLLRHPDRPDKDGYSKSEILELVEQEEKIIGHKIMKDEHKNALVCNQPF